MRVEGHALRWEGAGFDEDSRRVNSQGTGGGGRGWCECGEMSPWYHSAADRKRWHQQHKAAHSPDQEVGTSE